ncbi:T9SS type A sorting domain-containing protein [uncultured Polaribacter sp.]|uniref:T9SS type A sorting domain-containing protein n=1 Tax=uncultured Polaribacter sp. TaxID=174711 RepID=UPI002604FC27|nr:T9SS type A sorting domain-containing protein [uncultured Polaribacter sp.]
MKRIYSALFLCALSYNINAQSVSLPKAYITNSPIGTVENNGSSTAGFSFTESSGVEVPYLTSGKANVNIEVNLQYLQLQKFDVSMVTGSLLEYFTPVYNISTNLLTFEQNSNIPADWSGSVEFPIEVTQNSSKEEFYNGIDATITANDANTNADGNASTFTYTDASVLAVNDLNDLLFEVTPNPTTGIVNIKLQDSEDTKVELFDIIGKSIMTKNYTSLDNISFNIDYLPAAVYLLKVTSNGGATNSIKILKK